MEGNDDPRRHSLTSWRESQANLFKKLDCESDIKDVPVPADLWQRKGKDDSQCL